MMKFDTLRVAPHKALSEPFGPFFGNGQLFSMALKIKKVHFTAFCLGRERLGFSKNRKWESKV